MRRSVFLAFLLSGCSMHHPANIQGVGQLLQADEYERNLIKRTSAAEKASGLPSRPTLAERFPGGKCPPERAALGKDFCGDR